MVLVGSSVFERSDSNAVLDTLKKISLDNGVVKESIGWNGFNVLHRDVGRINALEVGVTPKRSSTPPKVVVLLGSDNNLDSSLFTKDAFVIYIGHHGDEGAYYADLILPAASYVEKYGTYVSTEGRVQQGRLAVPPAGEARPEWEILRALSEECG